MQATSRTKNLKKLNKKAKAAAEIIQNCCRSIGRRQAEGNEAMGQLKEVIQKTKALYPKGRPCQAGWQIICNADAALILGRNNGYGNAE